jgi:hypothetical protein
MDDGQWLCMHVRYKPDIGTAKWHAPAIERNHKPKNIKRGKKIHCWLGLTVEVSQLS